MGKYFIISAKQLNIIRLELPPTIQEFIDHIKAEQHIGDSQLGLEKLKQIFNERLYEDPKKPLNDYKNWRSGLYQRKFKPQKELKAETKKAFGMN